MSEVAVVQCETYEREQVYQALKRGLDYFGGITHFVSEDEKILLKPNLLRGKDPSGAVTTHPAVFEGVIRLLQEAGCTQLTYGDSPGMGSPEKAARESGLTPVAEQYRIAMGDFTAGQTVTFSEGVTTKQFEIANGVLEADAIISLCKMKTHGLTRITGAIKNQLGCVYGFNKSACHARFPKAPEFSRMLVDLNLCLKPRLYIMDGIIAMEGNGPASGDPVPMNCLLISDDPVALDATFATLVDLDPAFCPMIKAGQEMGLGSYETLQWVGDALEPLVNKTFKVERLPVKDETSVSFFLGKVKYLKGALVRKPVLIPERCIGCGACVRACPLDPKAIRLVQGRNGQKPKYDTHRCIRCYCCQEMCPQKALRVHTPLLGKLFIYRS